ncbi:dihydrodipicolinate synthase family protein [Candidatus Neomarinimicrobiota bacterium]
MVAAPLTGFNPDGTVNLAIIPRYAEMLKANGMTGVFINGTTGEGMSLTNEERRVVAKRWVEAANGLRVIIHVGHACQADSQELAVHALKIGADGMAEIGPIFFRPQTIEALVEYTAVTAASAPELPYYYYHMPSMNQVLFPIHEYLNLAGEVIPNLAGIKFTHDDITDFDQCIKHADGKFDMLFGRDEFLLDGLKAGAIGAVGSTYNIMSRLYLELIKAFQNNDLKRAEELQKISADICKCLHNSGGFGSGLKYIMRIIGIELGYMRRPQTNLSKHEGEELGASLEALGLFKYLNQ